MERVLIVGVDLYTDLIEIDTSMDELEELVKAAGGVVISRVIQKIEGIHAASKACSNEIPLATINRF